MFRELPLVIVVSYTIFTFFQFYQALHGKNFRGGSEIAALVINISAFVGMLFSYGYLIYYGVTINWYWPIVLFVVALVIKSVWFFIEAKAGLKNHAAFISLAGFIVLPICGYLLVTQMP